VVVLGCSGLVGSALSKRIVHFSEMSVCDGNRPLKVKRIVLLSRRRTNEVDQILRTDSRVKFIKGDICNPRDIKEALDPEGCTRLTVYHLAALLSGNSEENFDLGMKVNLFGTLRIMEEIRRIGVELGAPQIYVFTSSDYVTCFNKTNRENPTNEESFRLSPVSYGCQKACIELLLSDYSRKGFIDGRIARLSAVIGRPGWSNSISFPYTGIFTIPLAGKDYECPLPLDVQYPCSMLSNNVEVFIKVGTTVRGEDIGHNRVIQFPCISLTLRDIWKATQEFAHEEGITLGTVSVVDSSAGSTTVKEINVCPRVSCAKAKRLGLPMRFDMKEIAREFYHTYCKNNKPSSKI